MPPRRKMVGKRSSVAEQSEEEEEEEEDVEPSTELAIPEETRPSDESAIVAVKRGGGRGLKAVQSTKELKTNSTKADGSTVGATTKHKEQKTYTADRNIHVETKTMTTDSRTKRKRDGSVTTTETTTVKKVCYV